jgi:hypothetical protein
MTIRQVLVGVTAATASVLGGVSLVALGALAGSTAGGVEAPQAVQQPSGGAGVEAPRDSASYARLDPGDQCSNWGAGACDLMYGIEERARDVVSASPRQNVALLDPGDQCANWGPGACDLIHAIDERRRDISSTSPDPRPLAT